MFKKITCLLLSMVFLSGTFTITGCSSKKSDKGSETKKTIKFATFFSNTEQGGIYKDIAREYEKENPDVKVEVTSDFGNEEKLKDAMNGNNQYDIIGIKRNQLIEYAKSGKLADLSDFTQKNQLDSKLYPIGLAYGSYNGRQYGFGDLPIVCEWFYNTDIFKKNKLKEPETLKELFSISKNLKSKGIRPISIGAIDGWTVSMLFGMITAQTTGSTQFTDNYGTDMDTFKNMASMNSAFGIFNDLAANSISKDCDSINYRQSVEDFVAGKAAILPAGSYAVELIEKAKHAGFNYNVFSKGVEMTKNPKSLYSTSASEVLTIPASSKNQADAEKFLNYIMSDKTQKKFTEKGYYSILVSSNTPKNDIDRAILNHLQSSNGMSVMLFDNLEPTMLESLTMVLKDCVQGRVKAKEAWSRVLKFTYQR